MTVSIERVQDWLEEGRAELAAQGLAPRPHLVIWHMLKTWPTRPNGAGPWVVGWTRHLQGRSLDPARSGRAVLACVLGYKPQEICTLLGYLDKTPSQRSRYLADFRRRSAQAIVQGLAQEHGVLLEEDGVRLLL